jgi:hypothetical protein
MNNRLFDKFPPELKQEVVEYRMSRKKSKPSKNSKKFKKSNKLLDKSKKPIKTDFAFPSLKKLPLATERQIKSAMVDFDKVKCSSEQERAEAYKKIINRANSCSICTMGFSSKFEHCLFNTDSKESE